MLKDFLYRKENFINIAVIASLFSAGYLFLGPAIHELSHLILLELSKCNHVFEHSFNFFQGFRGSYKVRCVTHPYLLSLFYFSGYLGTAIASFTCFYLSGAAKLDEKEVSALGAGMLLSVASSITLKGDVFNGLKALGIERISSHLEIGLTLLVLLATLIEVERYVSS